MKALLAISILLAMLTPSVQGVYSVSATIDPSTDNNFLIFDVEWGPSPPPLILVRGALHYEDVSFPMPWPAYRSYGLLHIHDMGNEFFVTTDFGFDPPPYPSFWVGFPDPQERDFATATVLVEGGLVLLGPLPSGYGARFRFQNLGRIPDSGCTLELGALATVVCIAVKWLLQCSSAWRARLLDVRQTKRPNVRFRLS